VSADKITLNKALRIKCSVVFRFLPTMLKATEATVCIERMWTVKEICKDYSID